MQRTQRYLDPSTLAGTDPAAGLGWLQRQDAWDRRLEALEADRADDAEATGARDERQPELAR